jgi:hypothetical protein
MLTLAPYGADAGGGRIMNSVWKQSVVVAAACCTGFAAVATRVAPISCDFSVTATSGPLTGTTADGIPTFGSINIVSFPPGYNFATGLLTALNFTWDGITYNAGTANTGALDFDAAGNVITALFGTDCRANSCNLPAGQETWAFCGGVNCGVGFFDYRVSGVPGFGEAAATIGPRVTVPEPRALALLGLGLGGLRFSRRKQ